MFIQALKDALLFTLIVFHAPILYIAFCLGRGIIDDIRKGVKR